jgi:hypothetical protein
MNNISMQDVDPRILLAHYEEVIARKRESVEGVFKNVPGSMLLDMPDRKHYLMCLGAMQRFESVKGTMGIQTPADMVEHIQLVEYLALNQSEVSAGELRTFSLQLLRSMQIGKAVGA